LAKVLHEIKELSKIPVTGREASERGIDYTKLRDYLEKEEFWKADQETAMLMLQVARREHEGYLKKKDIKTFPSKAG
jgi:GUN4-like